MRASKREAASLLITQELTRDTAHKRAMQTERASRVLITTYSLRKGYGERCWPASLYGSIV